MALINRIVFVNKESDGFINHKSEKKLVDATIK